ncbi:MAG: hypothetical protein Unbinned92contig1003_43 [Prokaryotic dsDNA virus sp.]|nr:MAG: hypothetical protein Unbinned92contig1003_43 [Prokaryotic dsDNA virus sp.]|tara:strand:+ start:4759 stop:4911 length:153 start_codon:yes stop_codon:yes gene_type:complete
MFSLNRKDFEKFETIDALIDYCVERGICPSAEVTIDGRVTGETLEDFLQY